MLGRIGFFWGAIGVVGLLITSVVRLSNIALEFLHYPAQTWHYVALALWVAFMAYSEGYKGFSRPFRHVLRPVCYGCKITPNLGWC